MLEVDDISVSYGRIPAVRGVSLTVDEGEIVTLVGPNGAGKSTTLMTVAGALTPTSGTVRLNGEVIVGKGPENIARLGVSIVPEGRHVFTRLTVEENIRLGTDMRATRSRSRPTSSACSPTSPSCAIACPRPAASSRAGSSSSSSSAVR